ncbi:hypothetical protein ZWY2020_037225 [Hordeum vulgare]|nr:hypothetical protein ZWY2020_037225 [Hordeum vulgare]
MIDMGFEPQVVGVLDEMPPSHLKPENADKDLDEARTYMTNHMFSTTMTPAMERLARKFLRNPVAVTVGFAGKAADLVGMDAGPIVVAKPRDRFRFDWVSKDDTSRVDAANNQPAHGTLLLYGRGFLAGIDRREQKKVAAAAL